MNKEKKDYTCLLPDSYTISKGCGNTKPSCAQKKKHKTRRKNNRADRLHAQTEANKGHIKNLSNVELTNDQINLLAKGLKFIPTPRLLQPIEQKQKSYLKDTTDFINFIETTIVPDNAILVSMDVTSLYTNIPQEEGTEAVCKSYDSFYKDNPPIPKQYL